MTYILIKLNRVSKVTKETYILVGKFDDTSVVYIRCSWCLKGETVIMH